MGSRGFRWSHPDNLGVLVLGEDCTNVHLERLTAGVQEPVSMFTTYTPPAALPMLSVMKCPQPTRFAVEQANICHVFVQSRGRLLRAVALLAFDGARQR